MATGGEESTRPYLLVPRTKSPCYETSAFIRQLRWPLFIFPFHCVFYEFVFRLEPFLEQTRRVQLMAVDGLAPEAPSHRTMAAVIRTNVARLVLEDDDRWLHPPDKSYTSMKVLHSSISGNLSRAAVERPKVAPLPMRWQHLNIYMALCALLIAKVELNRSTGHCHQRAQPNYKHQQQFKDEN